MKKYCIHISVALTLLLVACTKPVPNTEELPTETESSSSVETSSEKSSTTSSVRETRNVTYTGTVRPAGISIYQEGTHRLVFEDSKFILLESSTADLNGYVGEKVEVFGSLRPTVEEGAMIMRVDRISLLDTSSESSLEEELSSDDQSSQDNDSFESDSSESSSEEDSSSSVVIPELPTKPDASSESSIESSKSSEEISSESISEDSSQTISPLEDIIVAMSQDDYAPERWSQEYCSSHIGFCMSVHKNWWFKSFGTTTNDLWHIELSNKEIDHLGDGPIIIKLLSGTVGSKKAVDGQVRVQGNTVIGFKEWDDSRHFEVIADQRLQPAVEYIVKNLRRSE